MYVCLFKFYLFIYVHIYVLNFLIMISFNLCKCSMGIKYVLCSALN